MQATQLTPSTIELCEQVRAMCACNHLRRAARGVTGRYEAALESSGVKVTQLPILVALALSGELALSPLATHLQLDRTTLTRNAEVLERHGLVAIRTDAGDARVHMVRLTPAGAEALTTALRRWQDVQVDVEAAFGRERLLALYGELRALTEALEA